MFLRGTLSSRFHNLMHTVKRVYCLRHMFVYMSVLLERYQFPGKSIFSAFNLINWHASNNKLRMIFFRQLNKLVIIYLYPRISACFINVRQRIPFIYSNNCRIGLLYKCVLLAEPGGSLTGQYKTSSLGLMYLGYNYRWSRNY